ncbi:response regulator [Paludibaculum fermentans]|uniref:Response regulator n=1 Tax=Paludibaculum fermentans TaxID=1473598 RepID=A0A7S7SN06_PALFE|nr:response regulator [Paludibaculum fermentans]QOY90051.1 response regulator [Paludibaculum fermentans]
MVQILLVSEAGEDHESFRELLADPACGLPGDGPWVLRSRHSIASALAVLEGHPVPIVLSACELGSDTWREMLDALAAFSRPPLLIVISRLDDEGLWAEALNLGVYDLLVKPFDADEVGRILGQAWRRWAERDEAEAAKSPRYKTAHAS